MALGLGRVPELGRLPIGLAGRVEGDCLGAWATRDASSLAAGVPGPSRVPARVTIESSWALRLGPMESLWISSPSDLKDATLPDSASVRNGTGVFD